MPHSFVPGDEAGICVKWQEKIFGPGDIVALSSAQRSGGKPQQHRTVPRLEVRRREIRFTYHTDLPVVKFFSFLGEDLLLSDCRVPGPRWYTTTEIDRPVRNDSNK